MTIVYYPTEKFEIDNYLLKFGEKRQNVRSQFLNSYKEDDQLINFDTENLANSIYQKRDIYTNVLDSENLFFLNYDKEESLTELEIHFCNVIKVFDIIFTYDDDIDFIAKNLSKYTPSIKKNSDSYIFEELRISISSKRQMGGIDNTLGYFYCASDISHLVI